MADYDRRPNHDRRPRGGRGRFNDRKRRYGGQSLSRVGYYDIDMLIRSDDEYDGRNQRRRYEEPLSVSLRKQIMSIAESVRRE
jgi:nuclear cap-binding protein subunit 1